MHGEPGSFEKTAFATISTSLTWAGATLSSRVLSCAVGGHLFNKQSLGAARQRSAYVDAALERKPRCGRLSNSDAVLGTPHKVSVPHHSTIHA